MAVTLTPTITYKRLIAAGNNEIWYEDINMAAGEMVELTAANGDIDTSDQLQMFEAYQKVFIVNGSNLKVADFSNAKITTDNIGSHPPDKGNILTGGTSGAKMVVDFCTSLSGAAAIYGYRMTDATFTNGTFTNGETVTGTDDDGNSISFTLNANETAPPHWYDWTPYGNDTNSYGSMPEKAYLGCLYRGRCVLSGNPNYPYQWYMSRQANPWDWLYTANDAQAPVAGGNSDAGKIGDIIRCLIPYKDDYLIFGCANSIWVLRGDPCEGGSIDEVDRTIGIFGSQSWCFDNVGSLYFWGTGGIYRLPVGFGPIEHISSLYMPKLVDDEAPDPSTHRVLMAYDRQRNGILICITKLSDGTNSNYWYDLKTGGFYPESYPTECGAYSLLYYDALDKNYRDLLVGCKDGYIRKFDESAKDDDSGPSDTAISSYATLSIIKLTEEDDKEGKITSLTFELAGGASGSDFSDTDGLSYEIHVGDDAETVLEKIRNGDTAFASGTLTGPGRTNRIRTRARGAYLGLKLYNSTASQTWAINRITGQVIKGGKIK